MRASRITIAVLALFALCIAPVALAETPSATPAKVEPQSATATTNTVTTATDQSVSDALPEPGVLDFMAPTEDDFQQTTAGAAAYCTRAIDIDGVFCFIGCPEGCNCDVETFFSECCCEVQ